MNNQFTDLVKFGISLSINDGKKTINGMPKSWQKLEHSLYNNEANYAILTGKINDIIVIDLDNKDTEFSAYQWFVSNFGDLDSINTLVTNTINGGYHIFFRYNKQITNKINFNNIYIDILTTGKCVYQGKGYDVVNNSSIRELSLSELSLFIHPSIIPDEPINSDDSTHDIYPSNTFKIIELLSSKRADSYDSWIKVGYYLSKHPNGLELFKMFSQKSNKYTPESIETQFKAFQSGKQFVKTEHLINWIYEDTPNIEKNIISEINDITKSYNVENLDIVKQTKTQIDTSLMDNNVLKCLHDTNSKKCSFFSPLCKTTKNGIQVYCTNCNFVYPNQPIILEQNMAPIIFNLLMTNPNEDFSLKETLSVAKNIQEYINIIYLKDNWFVYNESNGIYEYNNKHEMISIINDTALKIQDQGQQLTWLKWTRHITYKEQLLKELMAQCHCKKNISFDSFQHLLGFPNGVLDLNSMEFRKGQVHEYISLTCGIEYNDTIDTSLAFTVLQGIFPNELELNFALNRFCLSLSGRRENSFVLNYGHTASNGKSFIMECLFTLFGDYADVFEPTLLTNKSKSAGDANSVLHNFKNKRFIYCSEPETGSKLNVNFIKSLVGDIFKARTLYEKEDLITPTYKMHILCNTLPNFDSYDEGIARRTRLIEYKTRFCYKPNPKRTNEVLIKEYNDDEKQSIIQGLLLILINQYKLLMNNDFKYSEPEYNTSLVQMYLNDNKNVIQDLLLDQYEESQDNKDFIKLVDIKAYLKTNGIIEKDIITLKYIVQDVFPDTVFKTVCKINTKQIRNCFLNLKLK